MFTEQEAINIVRKDKHSLLEGYVTEYLLEKQLLWDRLYTKGWWMASRNNKTFFFVVKNELNSLDEEIINTVSPNSQCWQVLYDSDWLFKKDNKEYNLSEFLSLYNLNVFRDCLNATEMTKNEVRQNKCIEFFKANDILVDIAVERLFADNILTRYFYQTVNIDFFYKKHPNSQVINIMEVKFKFESQDNCFGLNVGQYRMFKYFDSIGFNIYHFILYNKTMDKNLSVFGYVSLPDDEKYWLFKRLSDFTNTQQGTAPAETSIDGKTAQTYYKFSKDSFTTFRKLQVSPNVVLSA